MKPTLEHPRDANSLSDWQFYRPDYSSKPIPWVLKAHVTPTYRTKRKKRNVQYFYRNLMRVVSVAKLQSFRLAPAWPLYAISLEVN